MESSSASVSYYGRPLASSDAPVAGTPRDSTTGTKQQLDVAPKEFVPNLFDLISLARRLDANQGITKNNVVIPTLYKQSQAVDSSMELGSGATFVAYCRPIPKFRPKTITRDMGGWTTSTLEAPQERPEVVVYKTARVAFDKYGESKPENRRAAQCLLMEMYALSHGPLLEHPNIIQLLGLAWGSTPSDPDSRLPSVIVEYAPLGSLATLQESQNPMPAECIRLCAGVAEGLLALHQCGIVHGDIKSENVLICMGMDKKLIAKLGDFGFSLVDKEGQDLVHIGGTRPWRAPETYQPLTRNMLPKTDIYSFGLLLWRSVSGVKNPFVALIDPSEPDFRERVEAVKTQESFHLQVHAEQWYFTLRFKPQLDQALGQSNSPMVDQLKALLSSTVSVSPNRQNLISDLIRGQNPIFQEATGKVVSQYPWTARFNRIVDCCLRVNPEERDFASVIDAFRSEASYKVPESSYSSSEMKLHQDFEHHSISWETINMLDPNLQAVLADALLGLYESKIPTQTQEPFKYLILAALCVNGCGTRKNYLLAKDALILAAEGGSMTAQAYGWRILKGMGVQEIPYFNVVIARNASLGSRLALQDLAELEPETAKIFRGKNQELKAGIGGDFFSTKNMASGNTITAWLHFFDNARDDLVAKVKAAKDPSTVRLNKRGDRILHMAAACGKTKALEALFDACPDSLTINLLNDRGETPLLCACRSGFLETTKFLLGRGADASIRTPEGESVLHWLVSFMPSEIEEIGNLLFAAGADAKALTNTTIGYSAFPTDLDIDHKAPGSPLFWAVHENRADIVQYLMAKENSATWAYQSSKTFHNPMEQAAYFHHPACLKAMTTSLGFSRFTDRTTQMTKAILGANRFSMMVRHGMRWKQNFTETMDFVTDAMKNVNSSGVDGRGMTHLHWAVTIQRPEVVEYFLEHGIKVTEKWDEEQLQQNDGHAYTHTAIEAGRPGAVRQEHITLPHSGQGMTPLLEAVNTNQQEVLEMLVAHGASPLEVAINPFTQEQRSWTALHILAQARLEKDLDMCQWLLEHGVPVDGVEMEGKQPMCETPLMVACINDAFRLASVLMGNGADVNATIMACSFFSVPKPITLLGHIAASAARHSTARIRYLLYECPMKDAINFITEPTSLQTALHRAAAGCGDLFQRGPDVAEKSLVSWVEYDWDANREIMYELLQKWHEPEHLDAIETEDGETALHYAVTVHNAAGTELLLERGAKIDIASKNGKTACDLALENQKNMLQQSISPKARENINKIVRLLESARVSRVMAETVRNLEDLSVD